MEKLRKMILHKTIYDMRHIKRYSSTLAKPLSQLFNQPKSKFQFFIKNQTVSKLFMLIHIHVNNTLGKCVLISSMKIYIQ